MPSTASSSAIELLLNAEMEKPEMQVTQFFQSFDMEDASFQLREAMQIVLKNKFPRQQDSIEEENVRFFFEKLEKLVAAAYLLQ